MKINQPDVVCQVFPDEVVLINLRSGTYYTTNRMGADIVGMILIGVTTEKLQELIDGRWADAPPQVITDFLQVLFVEGLTAPFDPLDDAAAQAYPPRTPKLPFEAPVLDTHRDMQELLLLDPVHDVDEQGWPNKAVQE